MPGDGIPDTYREARKAGKLEEFRAQNSSSKKAKASTDTNSFLREDIEPGGLLAAKQVRRICSLQQISFRVEGLVPTGGKAVLTFERNEEKLVTETPLKEGSNEWNPSSLWNKLKPGDFLQITLKTEGEDVTPLKKVLTTLVVTHD